MIDVAMVVLSRLVSCQEAKVAMVKRRTIPVLIHLLRKGLPRNGENATNILLSFCKKDAKNMCCKSSLGVVLLLTELALNGTERAKRKAESLLDLLQRLQKQS